METQEKVEKRETEEKNVHFAGFRIEDDSKMKACKFCRVMVPKKAWICPNCKMKIRRHWGRLVLVLVLLCVIAGGAAFLALTERGNAAMASIGIISGRQTTHETAEKPAETEAASDEISGELQQTTGQEAAAQAAAMPETTEVSEVSAESEKLIAGVADKAAELASAADKTTKSAQEKQQEDIIEEALTIIKEDAGDDTEAQKKDAAAETMTKTAAEAEVKADTETEDGEEPEQIDPSAYSEEDFRELCELIEYRELMRTPQAYLGKCLVLEIEILEQVDGGMFDDQVYYLGAAEDAKGILRYYIVRDDRGEEGLPLFEGDSIRMYGQMFGTGVPKGDHVVSGRELPAVSMVYLDLL